MTRPLRPSDIEYINVILGCPSAGEVRLAHDSEATTLLDGNGPDARGLGAVRQPDTVELLRRGPGGTVPTEVDDATRHDYLRRFRQEVYARVAAGRGSEVPFHKGRGLAQRLGYPREIEGVPQASLDRFVGLANPWVFGPPPRGAKVCDLGCGAGLDAHLSAQWVGPTGKVVGLDLTWEMVDTAVSCPGYDGLAPLFVQGSVAALPLPDLSMDLVLANGVLMMAEDPATTLAEIHRVLQPEGELRFTDVIYGSIHGPVSNLARWNACRLRRPLASTWRMLLISAGFRAVRFSDPMDPFVPPANGGSSAAYAIKAVKSSRPPRRRPVGRSVVQPSSVAPVAHADLALDAQSFGGSAGSRPSIAPGIVEEEAGDDLLIWHPHHYYPLVLDPRARLIWKALPGASSVVGLVEELATATGALPDEIRDDVQGVIGALVRDGFLSLEQSSRSLVPAESLAARPKATYAHTSPPGRPEVFGPRWNPDQCFGALLSRPGSRRQGLILGNLRGTIVVDEPKSLQLLQSVVPGLLDVESPGRPMWLITCDLNAPPSQRYLLLTGSGLPLATEAFREEVVPAAARHIRATAAAVTDSRHIWFWAPAVADRESGLVVTLQPEFLHALPELKRALKGTPWVLCDTPAVGVDPDTGWGRVAGEVSDRELGGMVLWAGATPGVLPRSIGEAIWAAVLLAATGPAPLRAVHYARTLAAGRHLVSTGVVVTIRADPASLLKGLKRLAALRLNPT